jgi:hypothetical protein
MAVKITNMKMNIVDPEDTAVILMDLHIDDEADILEFDNKLSALITTLLWEDVARSGDKRKRLLEALSRNRGKELQLRYIGVDGMDGKYQLSLKKELFINLV